jgi:hypothetical protein
MVIPVVGVLVVGLTSGTVALGGTTEHHTHSAAHAITAAGHAHGALDTTPPTPDQERAAAVLLERSHASMARFADVAVAKRAGYRVIHNIDDVVLHYGHLGYMGDGRTLDPDHMESLIYVHVAGRDLLVGGMYLMPIGETGPAIGGSLTRWHAHDDLCLDPVKILALAQTSKGCPPGSVVRKTGEMLHVWAIAYPGGPFADLDATRLRTAVKQYYGIGDPE